MNLIALGWNEELEKQYQEANKQKQTTVGRVVLEHKGSYRVLTEEGSLQAEITGKFRYNTETREDYPAVGDWVVLERRVDEGQATIHAVLPRKSKFSRKSAGFTTDEQIVAANVDTVFLVTALNKDFNVRRIERYLIMAWESGATPVIVLSKADLCNDYEEKLADVEAIAFGVPVHVVSAVTGSGLEDVRDYLEEGHTAALLGSSGVGKSTLINALFGEEVQVVQEIREGDDRGKHTTTHRELIPLPSGGLLIDTPGMRELQLWEASDSIDHSFQDIEMLAEQCRFRDCKHDTEPGCVVKKAIDDGSLAQERFDNYLKLQRELAYLQRKTDKKAQLEERKKWKKIAGDRTRFHR